MDVKSYARDNWTSGCEGSGEHHLVFDKKTWGHDLAAVYSNPRYIENLNRDFKFLTPSKKDQFPLEYIPQLSEKFSSDPRNSKLLGLYLELEKDQLKGLDDNRSGRRLSKNLHSSFEQNLCGMFRAFSSPDTQLKNIQSRLVYEVLKSWHKGSKRKDMPQRIAEILTSGYQNAEQLNVLISSILGSEQTISNIENTLGIVSLCDTSSFSGYAYLRGCYERCVYPSSEGKAFRQSYNLVDNVVNNGYSNLLPEILLDSRAIHETVADFEDRKRKDNDLATQHLSGAEAYFHDIEDWRRYIEELPVAQCPDVAQTLLNFGSARHIINLISTDDADVERLDHFYEILLSRLKEGKITGEQHNAVVALSDMLLLSSYFRVDFALDKILSGVTVMDYGNDRFTSEDASQMIEQADYLARTSPKLGRSVSPEPRGRDSSLVDNFLKVVDSESGSNIVAVARSRVELLLRLAKVSSVISGYDRDVENAQLEHKLRVMAGEVLTARWDDVLEARDTSSRMPLLAERVTLLERATGFKPLGPTEKADGVSADLYAMLPLSLYEGIFDHDALNAWCTQEQIDGILQEWREGEHRPVGTFPSLLCALYQDAAGSVAEKGIMEALERACGIAMWEGLISLGPIYNEGLVQELNADLTSGETPMLKLPSLIKLLKSIEELYDTALVSDMSGKRITGESVDGEMSEPITDFLANLVVNMILKLTPHQVQSVMRMLNIGSDNRRFDVLFGSPKSTIYILDIAGARAAGLGLEDLREINPEIFANLTYYTKSVLVTESDKEKLGEKYFEFCNVVQSQRNYTLITDDDKGVLTQCLGGDVDAINVLFSGSKDEKDRSITITKGQYDVISNRFRGDPTLNGLYPTLNGLFAFKEEQDGYIMTCTSNIPVFSDHDLWLISVSEEIGKRMVDGIAEGIISLFKNFKAYLGTESIRKLLVAAANRAKAVSAFPKVLGRKFLEKLHDRACVYNAFEARGQYGVQEGVRQSIVKWQNRVFSYPFLLLTLVSHVDPHVVDEELKREKNRGGIGR